ncbi:MAG: septal ring lytic transglycosylase RlpA family protein [Solirubrobacterales bacterium]
MAARAINQTTSSSLAARMPAGALPLAIATLVLVAVPFARAAGDDAVTGKTVTSGTATPIAVNASTTPKISARLLRSRSVNGSAITVRARVAGVGRGKAHVRMAVRAAGAKKWRIVRTANVRAGKKFNLHWRGGNAGRYMTRVSVRKFGKTDVDRTGRAYVFRKSFASWYGPGLYGGGLACGGSLSPNTVGVAHKTLPCGTRVTFKVGNRVVTARVIDRGPYVSGRDWDLTGALKRKLGFGSTGTVYATR